MPRSVFQNQISSIFFVWWFSIQLIHVYRNNRCLNSFEWNNNNLITIWLGIVHSQFTVDSMMVEHTHTHTLGIVFVFVFVASITYTIKTFLLKFKWNNWSPFILIHSAYNTTHNKYTSTMFFLHLITKFWLHTCCPFPLDDFKFSQIFYMISLPHCDCWTVVVIVFIARIY